LSEKKRKFEIVSAVLAFPLVTLVLPYIFARVFGIQLWFLIFDFLRSIFFFDFMLLGQISGALETVIWCGLAVIIYRTVGLTCTRAVIISVVVSTFLTIVIPILIFASAPSLTVLIYRIITACLGAGIFVFAVRLGAEDDGINDIANWDKKFRDDSVD
jgi:hypothetical protein